MKVYIHLYKIFLNVVLIFTGVEKYIIWRILCVNKLQLYHCMKLFVVFQGKLCSFTKHKFRKFPIKSLTLTKAARKYKTALSSNKRRHFISSSDSSRLIYFVWPEWILSLNGLKERNEFTVEGNHKCKETETVYIS